MSEFTYAVVRSGVVENAVVADSADMETPLSLLIPDADEIVLVTEETGPCFIRGTFVNGVFRPPQPFPSWTWDETRRGWAAPIEYPADGVFTWNEATQEWDPVS